MMDNHSRGMTAPTREAVSYPKQSVTLKKGVGGAGVEPARTS